MVFRIRSFLLTASTLALAFSASAPVQAQEGPDGAQAVLSQLDNAYSPDQGNILSSRFELVPGSDKIAADDFVVPAGTDWWAINGMEFIGQMCLDSGAGDQVRIVIYSNEGDTSNGKPGVAAAQSVATVAQGIEGNCAGQVSSIQYSLTPQGPIWIRPGQKYWVSVHSIAPGDNPFNRRLYWAGRSGIFAGTQPAFYYSGGSLSSCDKVWVERRVCDGTTAGDDMTWSLTYTAFRPNFVFLPLMRR